MLATFVITIGLLTAGQDQPPDPVVAATVNGNDIFVHDVQHHLKQVVQPDKMEPAALKILKAKTLERLVDQQLVLTYLRRIKLSASDQDVTLALNDLEARLKRRELSLEDYLKKTGMDTSVLRRRLLWTLSWQRMLNRYLTDDNLKRHFDRQRRHFDGSELQVAHILLKTKADDPEARKQAIRKAEQIRQQIMEGELDFAEAARQFSQSPSAKDGGNLGFIARHEPMPEAFSAAAFGLKVKEVSVPVSSPFGIHLIQCQAVKPGKKEWTNVKADLREAVSLYLFRWAADQEREGAQIKYTGSTPHFKPGTEELAN